MADSKDLIATLARSGRMRIVAALGVTALVGGSLGVIMLSGQNGDKALLYSGLSLEESATIMKKLDQANVRYEMRADGSMIFVPRSQVLDARMRLAEDGLPKRGSPGQGYEIFDKQDALGQTTFIQNMNRVRALEGELARTISSLEIIKSARVHLVLPERKLFEKDAQQPSATVVIGSRGPEITPAQVRAMRNLVASAVPGLKLDRITVVDEGGRLLASGAEASEDAMGGVGADERKAAIEDRYRQMVLQIVESVTGVGAARVQVSADVDFNRVTQSNETFNPDGKVLRSSTTVEDSSTNQSAEGGGATTVTNNVPGQQAAATAKPTNQQQSTRSEETSNYEISKTVRTEVIEGGKVNRLSVAVAVDDARTAGAAGKPPTYTPRQQQELDRINQLVKSAVGFDEKRGDKVEVVNIAFSRPSLSADGGEAKDALAFDKFDMIQVGEIAALLVTALALVFFVFRPLVKNLTAKPEEEDLGDVLNAARVSRPAPSLGLPEAGIDSDAVNGGEAGIDVARITGQVKASSIKRISEVVSTHPEESISIIRSWLHEENMEGAA